MKPVYFFFIFSFASICGAQQIDLHKQTDSLLYSGEIVWSMTHEIFQPAAQIPQDNKMAGLSNEQFSVWKDKLSGYRMQAFQIQAIFQGDYVFFSCISEPGDILPVTCDRIITYNGVSTTFMDNSLRILFRSAEKKRYRETHYSVFYISPRACGYDYKAIYDLVRNVKDIQGNPPVPIEEEISSESKIKIKGSYPNSGTATLALLMEDNQHPQVFQSIRYISPMANERVAIDNFDFATFEGGTVYPRHTTVTRYLSGNLEDLSGQPIMDRITLQVESARFGDRYSSEIFNPTVPEGYMDLNDRRSIQ